MVTELGITKSPVNPVHARKEELPRVVTEFEILSKDPTIRTQVPEGTYTLEKTGEKTILKIIDPVRFWDASKYLVIQL